MSSIFSGSDHIDHGNTQVPFAATAAGVTVIVLILFGVGLSSIIVLLPLAFVLTAVLVYGLNKWDARRKNLPEVRPTTEEIEEGEVAIEALDRDEVDQRAISGRYTVFELLPIAAILVVIGYLSLVFAFAILGR